MNEKDAPKISDLLIRAEEGLEITTRDDQDEFTSFLDAAKISRRNGGRLRLVDSGRFNVFELEWLAEAGVDIFTSDDVRPNRTELDLLAQACGRGEAIIAYFHRGTLSEGEADVPSSWAFLEEIGRSGVDVHLSNRERPRDLAGLTGLADANRKAGTRLVYYHHGRSESGLAALARAGAWIHLSDETLGDAEGVSLLDDLAHEASAAGTGVVLHLERGLPVETVGDLLRAGAFLLFKTPPSDRRSRSRAAEEQARKKKLDRRSYYLHTTFLP
ncbi:MAG: hypothetical protein OEW18_13320 [Candidatus Aminicenantes bacterium]|nr:hypothetical protein [Candidatus Aminicenantes bacterium]